LARAVARVGRLSIAIGHDVHTVDDRQHWPAASRFPSIGSNRSSRTADSRGNPHLDRLDMTGGLDGAILRARGCSS
jgi:hypothetical protein